MRKIFLLAFMLTSTMNLLGNTLSKTEADNKIIVSMKKQNVGNDYNVVRTKKVCPLVYLHDGTLEVHVANYRGLFSVEILDEEQFVCDATTRNVDGNFIYVSPATFDKDHHYCVFVTINGEKYVGEFDM